MWGRRRHNFRFGYVSSPCIILIQTGSSRRPSYQNSSCDAGRSLVLRTSYVYFSRDITRRTKGLIRDMRVIGDSSGSSFATRVELQEDATGSQRLLVLIAPRQLMVHMA